jgi:hypothetical protein
MAAYYDVADSGSLAYVPGPVATEIRFDLGVLDPRSGTKPMNLPPGGYEFPPRFADGWVDRGGR